MVNIIFKAYSNYSGRLNASGKHKIKCFELFLFLPNHSLCNERGVALLIPREQSVLLSRSVPGAAPALLSILNPGHKSSSALWICTQLNGTRSHNKVSGECPGEAAAPVVLREGHKAQGKASYYWTEMTE